MSNTPFNPYQPPAPVEPKPSTAAPDSAGIRYMHTYNYILENPNWMTNVLYGFLCILSSAVIPVLGQLLFMGYQFDVVEALHRYPGRIYPDFDFNKFSHYLQRSLWPFLASLICVLPMVIIIWVVTFVGILLLAAVSSAAGKDAAGIIMGLGMIVLMVVIMAFSLGVGLLIQPIILRAGLSQDFGQAFKFGWAIDFVKKVWLEMVLFQLYFMITGIPLFLLGILACFIGIYAAAAFMMLAQANMLCQLYNLFLARGGEPIPLKEPPPQPVAYAAS